MKNIFTFIGILTIALSTFAQNTKDNQELTKYSSLEKIIGNTKSMHSKKILYFTDGVLDTDQMLSALYDLPEGTSVTTTASSLEFEELLTDSIYNLAIFFIQNDNATEYTSAINTLINYVNNGGYCIYADWSGDNNFANSLGVNYTGNENNTEVTFLPPLSDGLSQNPITLVNSGWGVFSNGMTAIDGIVKATFSDGEAAIISGLNGHTLVYGFLSDVATSNEVFTTGLHYIMSSLYPLDFEICDGAEHPFFVSRIDSALTYQWFISSDEGITFSPLAEGGIFSGVENDTLSVYPLHDSILNYQFRCVGYWDSMSDTSRTAVFITDTQLPVWDIEDAYHLNTCSQNRILSGIPVPTDNCGIDSIAHNSAYGISAINPNGLYPEGTTVVSYYVRDLTGNILTGSFSVIVEDEIYPEWNLNDTMVISCEDSAYLQFPEPFDECGIDSVSHDSPYAISLDNPSGVYPVGVTYVNYYVKDLNGNTRIGTFAVEVIADNVDPVWRYWESFSDGEEFTNYSSTTTNGPTFDSLSGGVLTGRPYSSGTCCSGSNPPVDQLIFTPVFDGEMTITTTYSNYDGFVYLFTDPLNLASNPPTTFITADDDFGDVYHSQISASLISGQKYYLYSTGYNTSYFGEFTVEFSSPVVKISELVYESCDDSMFLSFPDPEDNCQLDSVHFTSAFSDDESNPSGYYPIGNTTIGYYISDANGNIRQGSLDLSVIFDATPPSWMPEDTITINACGNTAMVEFPIPFDTCGIDTMYFNGPLENTSNPSGDYEVGFSTIRYYIQDTHGNILEDSLIVSVIEDANAPEFDCQDTLIVNVPDNELPYLIDGDEFDPIVTDDCDFELINNMNESSSLNGVEIFEGYTEVMWIATDIVGNADTCYSIISLSTFVTLNDEDESFISVYPNPSSDGDITIVVPENGEMIITDITGKVIHYQPIFSGSNSIQIDTQSSGLFVVRIISNNNIHTQKLIIK